MGHVGLSQVRRHNDFYVDENEAMRDRLTVSFSQVFMEFISALKFSERHLIS